MAVNDALDVFTLTVDLQVEQGLARSLLAARNLLSCHVDQRDVIRFQIPFALERWRAEYFVFTDTNGDVAIVCCSELTIVNATANVAHVLFDFVKILHFVDPVVCRLGQFGQHCGMPDFPAYDFNLIRCDPAGRQWMRPAV